MALEDIAHIVVLMLENRSFDCMLGKLYPKSPEFDGLSGTQANEDLDRDAARRFQRARPGVLTRPNS